jgi:hypothetical protein
MVLSRFFTAEVIMTIYFLASTPKLLFESIIVKEHFAGLKIGDARPHWKELFFRTTRGTWPLLVVRTRTKRTVQ